MGLISGPQQAHNMCGGHCMAVAVAVATGDDLFRIVFVDKSPRVWLREKQDGSRNSKPNVKVYSA